ncbi:MAG: hypothetical protein ACBR13_20310 [Microcoleus sp.]
MPIGRKKEEGRRKKEEGRRKKEEGRRKKSPPPAPPKGGNSGIRKKSPPLPPQGGNSGIRKKSPPRARPSSPVLMSGISSFIERSHIGLSILGFLRSTDRQK